MRRSNINTLTQLLCSFQNCENWPSVINNYLCNFTRWNFCWSREWQCGVGPGEELWEKRVGERNHWCWWSGQRCYHMWREWGSDSSAATQKATLQSKQDSFFPMSPSHTCTQSETQYFHSLCYDHIGFCLYKQLLLSLVKWFSQILTFKVLGQCYAHLTHKVHVSINLQCPPIICTERWPSKGNPSLNVNGGQWRCMTYMDVMCVMSMWHRLKTQILRKSFYSDHRSYLMYAWP